MRHGTSTGDRAGVALLSGASLFEAYISFLRSLLELSPLSGVVELDRPFTSLGRRFALSWACRCFGVGVCFKRLFITMSEFREPPH